MLATNLPGRLSPTSVLRIYKDQPLVECAHRNNKQTLRVRPIFLHNDDRIEALISIIGLALVTFGLIEIAAQTPSATSPSTASYPKEPRRPAYRPQYPRRLPRPRTHLHPHRDTPRPTHPHPTTPPTTTRHHPPIAPTRRNTVIEVRKTGLVLMGFQAGRKSERSVRSRGEESSRGLFGESRRVEGRCFRQTEISRPGPSSRGSRREPAGAGARSLAAVP